MLGDYSAVPLEIERALKARGFVMSDKSSGIAKFTNLQEQTSITPMPGTQEVYVANVEGGTLSTRLVFTDGILTLTD